jgi:hypothetical protein
MIAFNARSLAALDMHGVRGKPWRRRAVFIEFVLAAAAVPAVGVWFMVVARTALGITAGSLVLGVGLNYIPLAWHATRLVRPGRLAAELEGLDAAAELRAHPLLWSGAVLVPLLLVVRELPTRRRAA